MFLVASTTQLKSVKKRLGGSRGEDGGVSGGLILLRDDDDDRECRPRALV